MPNLAELVLIIMVVAVVLSVHRLGRIGDALGAGLGRLFGHATNDAEAGPAETKTEPSSEHERAKD